MSKKKKPYTKQGVKRLSLDDNLFEEIEDDTSTSDNKFEKFLEESFSDKHPNVKVAKQQTKQGMKKLPIEHTLVKDINESNEPEESFDELLEESLTNKSGQALIKEKISFYSEKPFLSKSSRPAKHSEPQDEIDLHGLKGDEAELKTDFFIRDSKARGLVTIRIIVGKGTHSEGRAVLPDIVEGKIINLKREEEVHTFKWEKGKKLKSGSVIIYLA